MNIAPQVGQSPCLSPQSEASRSTGESIRPGHLPTSPSKQPTPAPSREGIGQDANRPPNARSQFPSSEGSGVGSPDPARKADSKECRVPAKKAALAAEHAPDVTLPLRFMALGLGSFLASVVWLSFRPDLVVGYHYGPRFVALTHLVVLGFITSVVMGAMYQLVPVALETKLHSERQARFHFWCHLIGVPGMVAMFWVWNPKQIGHFGSVFGLGVGLFAWNIFRTLRRTPRWNAVAYGIASSIIWLTLTMLAGLFLASAKCWPQINRLDPIASMHAHAHLGVLGAFVVLIVAVSYKLVPMFLLGELQSERRARWSIHLLNAGLLGLVPTMALRSPWKLAFAGIVVAGFAVYAVELAAILRARKRRSFDWGLRSFFTALALLGPLAALGVFLSWPGLDPTEFTARLENVYGFVAVFGVVAWAIWGMLYKILPFLVWYRAYGGAIGRNKVPALHEMYSHGLQSTGYWTYALGLIGIATAQLLAQETMARWSWLLLVASLGCFAANAVRIVGHLVRPQLQPLAATPKPVAVA